MGDLWRGYADVCGWIGAVVIALFVLVVVAALGMATWEWLTEQIWLAGDRIKQRRRAKGEPHG